VGKRAATYALRSTPERARLPTLRRHAPGQAAVGARVRMAPGRRDAPHRRGSIPRSDARSFGFARSSAWRLCRCSDARYFGNKVVFARVDEQSPFRDISISPPLRGRVPNIERVDLGMALRTPWRSSSGSGLPTRSVRKPSLWSSEVDFIWTAARNSLSGSIFAIAACTIRVSSERSAAGEVPQR
jgi:hypothetical protein